jgi:hypothetical protein
MRISLCNNRFDPLLFARYSLVLFDACDAIGRSIYHTNVMMSIGSDWAVICLDAVVRAADRNSKKCCRNCVLMSAQVQADRARVMQKLQHGGRRVVEVSLEQVGAQLITRHTSHFTRHTSHVTRPTSHVTRHTSHVTRHPSPVTRHTSHVSRHTPTVVLPQMSRFACNILELRAAGDTLIIAMSSTAHACFTVSTKRFFSII